MSKSIEDRITALSDALQRRAEMQAEPVDPLSASLYEFAAKMAQLNPDGIAALAAETDEDGRQILTLEQARAFANSFKIDI